MWIPLGGGLPLEERQVWTGLQHRSLDHPVGNDSPQLLRSRSVFRFLFTLDRHPCLCHHQRKSRRGCHLAVRVCHPLLCRIRTVCVGFLICPPAYSYVFWLESRISCCESFPSINETVLMCLALLVRSL